MHGIDAKHYTFNFNGDFSGDVHVCRREGPDTPEPDFVIPMDDLLELFEHYVRRRHEDRLEDMTLDEMIGLPKPRKGRA